MFEVPILISEYVRNISALVMSLPHYVVKHRIMAWVFFHKLPHRRNLMGVEYRLEVTRFIHYRRKYCWHTHELM